MELIIESKVNFLNVLMLIPLNKTVDEDVFAFNADFKNVHYKIDLSII